MSRKGWRWKRARRQEVDGFCLDAQFAPLEALPHILKDSLCAVLLDKDGMLPEGIEPSEESYIIRCPDPEAFSRTVNEFWWCSIGVAKAFARGELCHAAFMFESVLRSAILDILSWHALSLHGWKANTDKYGRFLLDIPTRDMVSEIELALRMELGVPGTPEKAALILGLIERMRVESLSGDGTRS